MTVQEAEQHGTQVLRRAKIESARIDSYILLEKLTGKQRPWLLAHPEFELEDRTAQEFTELITKRSQRIPLVHLTNEREFYGLSFYIDDGVLTPRVETEKMVDYAIKYAPRNSRLIDIGTGSGAIAIAIKTHRPDLTVVATDVTDEALAVARKNIETHKVDIELTQSDLFENVSGTFDTVVTNLPYLKDDADLMPEVQKEPAVALFGGEDGLDLYRTFLSQLPTFLSPNGYLFTECDPWQHEALISQATKAGLSPIEQADYFILGFQRA